MTYTNKPHKHHQLRQKTSIFLRQCLLKCRIRIISRIPIKLLFTIIVISLLVYSQFNHVLLSHLESTLYDPNLTPLYPIHHNQSEFSIFYNIYVPATQPEQSNALRIVKEQMHQIHKSYARSYKAKLYYNTLGADHVVNQTYMAQYCDKFQSITCEHSNHYDEGTELLTLTQVHQHCSQPPPNNNAPTNTRRVVYLHNKGSFHSNPFNEQWRRLMTYAVTSEECLHPPSNHRPPCNLCGLYFTAERGFFFPGNFWTASCHYVAQLLPPQQFAIQSTRVIKDALLKLLKHEFDFDLYEFVPENYGVDRYADELWVASHPTVRSCDFSLTKTKNFGTGYSDPFFEWVLGIWDPFQIRFPSLQWSLAPSLPLTIPKILRVREPWGWGDTIDRIIDLVVYWDTPTSKANRVKKRMREFTYLPGNLFKWINIYDQVPPDDSWIWDWFPDGDRWKKAWKVHGKEAVEIVTKENHDDAYLDPVFQVKGRRKWD